MQLSLLENIVSLFYPEVCAACGNVLFRQEQTVCTKCQFLLPKTGYEKQSDNPLAQIFFGRVDFHAVTACFFFSKKGKVQHLVHELKYKKNREAGYFLGREMGKILVESPLFNDVNLIIPAPLHPKRQHQRGYNQSEILALGMCQIMHREISVKHLLRAVNTATQTKKSREERYENMKNTFVVKNTNELEGKHVLLVDDVITTGATLEACGKLLLEIPKIKVSIATAACAG